ncbi:MAG: pantetheine-phosphate adenylyltransferase [Sphaerochaetaceae bacterium]|jgi:pantetheine-phosphate adenylyltransferase|nr:pantetheine-phosphate adenylyltransferase [Sphaerochaetaceae bacterium]NLO61287.1 pantetheine-phosphate adenylyltransferase [Spirochaetales bacterium]MDD2406142.1 pantetheine-phosphate adenylyltransferase [Sphaerochaetaceae bacterium]MDD3671139.1 pantetheine-phosphate adenylyltransferase [Sphaerochaetaceae bacterium]MDD4259065.1 pantetheine-phosphate adenylyltransferase [Sphaerochaetaceae bacterium]
MYRNNASSLKAMLPGTFDPPTNGHMNLIERSAKIFDSIAVVVADNISKKCLFTADERLSMLKELLKEYDNVEVVVWNGLIVDFAKQHNISVMIRGVRALVDFGYEFELAMTNKQLLPELEVMFMPTDPKFFVLRSSAIKEMAAFGADISKMVPELVAQKLVGRMKMLT